MLDINIHAVPGIRQARLEKHLCFSKVCAVQRGKFKFYCFELKCRVISRWRQRVVSSLPYIKVLRLPWCSDGKEATSNAADPGSIPGWRRSPGEGNGSPRQYSCLKKLIDKGASRATYLMGSQSGTQLSK